MMAKIKNSKNIFPNIESSAREFIELTESQGLGIEEKKRLDTIQRVTEILVSTLSFQDLIQKAVNLMSYDLNSLGGALLIVDRRLNKLRSIAYSETRWVKRALKVTGMPEDRLINLEVSLEENKNSTVQAVINKKIYISQDLREFICPPVGKRIAAAMQSISGVKIAIAVPIIARGKSIGSLLLTLPRNNISDRDLFLLQTFANQAGVALENARLYDKVTNFNKDLKKKIEKATEQIQHQYQDLLVLRKITDVITSTLDLRKVAQEIVNSVTTRLNFVAGMISLIDADTYQMYTAAISDTEGMRNAREIAGETKEKFISVDDKENLLAAAARDMKIQTTDKLSDVLSPPINVRIAQRIQKMNRIRGVAVLPIIAQGRALGALAIGIDKSTAEITDQEKETLITLANEAGLAIDNAQLFERTQKFNIELKDEVSRATKELKDANIKLTKLDKAKSEFISIASHQLRTPLSTIKGYISMILDGDFGIISDDVGKVLTRVYNSNERLVALVNNMLNVSRIESGRIKFNPQPIQIELIIEDVLKELAPEARSQRVDLIFKKPNWKPKLVMADQKLLHEVIMNLVDNGIKYTSHGSVIVKLKRHWQFLEIQIKDDGIGMTKDDLNRLFKKFSRGRDAYRHYTGGSGLGLYVVRKLIELNGGRIEGTSKGKGKGSLFKFTVPYA